MCTINIISLYNFTFFIFLPIRCPNLLEFNSSIIIVEKLLKNRNVHPQFLLLITNYYSFTIYFHYNSQIFTNHLLFKDATHR